MNYTALSLSEIFRISL